MSHCKFLKRGRNRHQYLRKVLSKVHCINDLENSFVSEIAVLLKSYFPSLQGSTKITIKAEVPILNRRPDFVILIQNIALILLEYKTSNTTLAIRKCYLKQTKDTVKNAKSFLSNDESHRKIKLLSVLLIRNSSKKQNRVICIQEEEIDNKLFFLTL